MRFLTTCSVSPIPPTSKLSAVGLEITISFTVPACLLPTPTSACVPSWGASNPCSITRPLLLIYSLAKAAGLHQGSDDPAGSHAADLARSAKKFSECLVRCYDICLYGSIQNIGNHRLVSTTKPAEGPRKSCLNTNGRGHMGHGFDPRQESI